MNVWILETSYADQDNYFVNSVYENHDKLLAALPNVEWLSVRTDVRKGVIRDAEYGDRWFLAYEQDVI